jgi:preprotein translocase subunit SecA
MFDNMIESIQENIVITLCKLNVEQVVERKNAFEAQVREVRKKQAGIYSNTPCPCGSGKKYKHCCGKKA